MAVSLRKGQGVLEGSGWRFKAFGEPFETDTFVHILRDRNL
jgi:hypothetical protein